MNRSYQVKILDKNLKICCGQAQNSRDKTVTKFLKVEKFKNSVGLLMSAEQELLKKWCSLPQDKQKQVLDFVDFLYLQSFPNKTVLEERFQKIRTRISEYSNPLHNHPQESTGSHQTHEVQEG